jgi:putative ABC transport system substrate-binding protein
MMHTYSNAVRSGGLMYYGADLGPSTGAWRVCRPAPARRHAAEMPMEQSTSYELVVNLKAANAIGLALPPLRLAADQVLR